MKAKYTLLALLASVMFFAGCSTMQEYLLDEEVKLIGGLATLVLGVGAGAVGTKVRKDKQLKDVQSTEDKMNEAFSRTLDDLRDLLDQTEGGEQIDEFLQSALSSHADKLQVAGKVLDFFKRYESPTKPKGGIKLTK